MKPDFIPAELIGKFETITEAANALLTWKKENRGPGRPRTLDSGVKLSILKKLLKTV